MFPRRLAPGMELHVPVLFLDVADDILASSEEETKLSTGELFGEKAESMIQLPIIRKDSGKVRGVSLLCFRQSPCRSF